MIRSTTSAETEFTNRRVLITGGTRGLGRATALLFAAQGARVVLMYERDEAAANDTRDEVLKHLQRSSKNVCTLMKMPVHDEYAWVKASESIRQSLGGVDIVVANAGIWKRGPLETMTASQFRETMEVNMTGTFLAAKFGAALMQRGGAIVIVSSTAGQRGESEHSHYAASKGAQISFTKSLAVELAPRGIRVNCVAPGWINTEMTADALNDPITQSRIQQQIPLQRIAEPSEVAEAILFLASNTRAGFITGEILNVTGGAVLCG